MRRRWSLILPVCGLLLFSLITLESIETNMRHQGGSNRFFWWSFIRLDSDPLNRHSIAPAVSPCHDGAPDCVTFELEARWVTPGWLDKSLLYSALPAFLVEALLLVGLGPLGL